MSPPRQRLAPPKREIEASLVIVTKDPELVFRRLGRLRELGDYRLAAEKPQRLVDHYFDTRDGRLRKRGFALRLRSLEGSTLISLKGPPRPKGAREDRSEAERRFSLAAVDEVRKRAHLPSPSAPVPRKGTPAEVVESALGVSPIQTRQTSRLVRRVIPLQKRQTVAELVLDRVEFRVGRRSARHYEVEIEAKQPSTGPRAVRALSDELLARYPDELMPWPYGKLATGKALEDLAERGELQRLGRNGVLTATAYDRIRNYLEPPR